MNRRRRTSAASRRTRDASLWPGIAIAALIVLVRYVIPFFIPEADLSGVLVGVVGAALILIWWLFFSRAPWSERIGALFVIAAAVIAIKPLVHPSISNGFMDRMFYVYAVPASVAPALVAWALFSRRLLEAGPLDGDGRHDGPGVRRVDAVADRRDHGRRRRAAGAGAGRRPPSSDCSRRASRPVPVAPAAPISVPADAGKAPADAPPSEAPVTATEPTATTAAKSETRPARTADDATARRTAGAARGSSLWRGSSGRDSADRRATASFAACASRRTGPSTPPVKMWHRPIGPGWSSFAVAGRPALHAGAARRGRDGRRLPHQHRRAGVAAPRHGAVLGVERRRGPARHTDAAQRPRLRVRRDRASSTRSTRATARSSGRATSRPRPKKQIPMWGFSSSPLVVGDMVVVAAAGKLAGYRPRHRQAALARSERRRRLQLAAPRHHRRRRRRSCS